MKYVMPALLVATLFTGGCLFKRVPPGAGAADAGAEFSDAKLLVTPGRSLAGRVATYNMAGRFVVLDFPVGHMPALGQTLFVYREGLKVGEVKVTGPERDNNTVADLVSGEAGKGDEVRDR